LSRIAFAALALAGLAAGCTRQPTPAPPAVATAVPTIPLQASSGAVRASANVVPARKAELALATAGRIRSVPVAAGDQVEAGALLLALDQATAEATLAQAQTAVVQAQARLDELRSGARPEEIAAAQARLEAAQARLTQLNEGARPEEIAAAQAELAAAQAAQQRLFGGPQEEDRIAAQATLDNAKAALQQAQAAYDRVASRSDVGMLPESRQLQEATNNYTAAKARYDALFDGPDSASIAAARAQVQQAQAALDGLQAPATPGQIAEAEAQVHSAQADLDLLKAGTREQDVTVAEGAVAEAEAAVKLAQSTLDNTELRAPFAGTVTALDVEPGEMVLLGQAVVTLADLSRLQVETTDLSERDVARVAVGQPVTVFVEPLNADIPGRVLRIAPQANVVAGDVVYTVVVELDEQPSGLRWGMSAEVEIGSE
jgi:HlyD family secretion protein